MASFDAGESERKISCPFHNSFDLNGLLKKPSATALLLDLIHKGHFLNKNTLLALGVLHLPPQDKGLKIIDHRSRLHSANQSTSISRTFPQFLYGDLLA